MSGDLSIDCYVFVSSGNTLVVYCSQSQPAMLLSIQWDALNAEWSGNLI